ncbi:alpha/beta hydrolase [Halomonas elongata]|uniref:alpha/beta hydrolase n=1 Tax=Halomonas elongata TaxID=2746 RepID=UPI0023AFBC2F|nr:alpha/beta hydrolase-fold protein [Halomonas elongata]
MSAVARGVAFAILTLLVLVGQVAAGQVTHHRFHSEVLGRDYPYTLYLPVGYHDSGLEYPVIYLLHGSFGSDRDWVNRGRLEAVADRMIRRGRIPPAVIVMPGSRSWWVDGHNEPARTAFLEELMPQVEALWRVVPEREWRGIAGLSAGGYGTVNMILERPELFGAAAALSPASYYPLPPADSTARRHPAFLTPDRRFDAELWRQLNYPAHLDGYLAQERVVPLYLSAGDRDRFDAMRHARRLQAALEVHQPGRVPLEVLPGGHSWRVWRASLGPALEFMFRHLRAPIPTQTMPSSTTDAAP